jgi:hypothetical protein
VLQLDLKQLDHVHGETGDAGYCHRRELVGGVHLADRPVRHEVSLGGGAVAGHHHPALITDRQDRGPFGDVWDL